MTKFTAFTESDLAEIAAAIIEMIEGNTIIFLYGDLGAGKTTLVKHICKLKGIDEDPSSPTYSIVNEYQTGNESVYHIDLYRLADLEEALDAGIEEYLYSDSPCFIEWPQIIEPICEKHITIVITLEEDGSRLIEVSKT